MTRKRGDKVWVFHLLVEIANECLSCSVACCYVADGLLHRLACLVVDDSHHAVYTEQFQNLLYLVVVDVLVYLWQQPRFKVCILCEYGFSLVVKRHSDGAWLVVLRLLGYVFHRSVYNVCTYCCPIKVANKGFYTKKGKGFANSPKVCNFAVTKKQKIT